MADRPGFGLAVFDLDGYAELRKRDTRSADRRLRELRKRITDAFPDATLIEHSRDGFAAAGSMSVATAALAAEKIRAGLETDRVGDALGTVSVGVAVDQRRRREPAELVAAATGALRQAKREGRNRVVVAEPEAMVMKSTYYPRGQLARLAAIAGREERTEASLLREALDHLLTVYEE